MYKKPLFFLFLVFSVNLPSIYYSWYLKLPWFDVLLHFLGGFFIAMLLLVYLKDHFIEGKKIKNILILVGSSVFVGVVWEFSEYLANQLLTDPFYQWFGIRTYFMGDLKDTMADLLLDILGALLFGASHFLRSRNSHKA